MEKYPRAQVMKYTGTFSPNSAHDHYEVYKVFNRFGKAFRVSVHASGYVGVSDYLTGRWIAGTMSNLDESWEQTVERLEVGWLTLDSIEHGGTVLIEMSNT